MWKDDIEYRRAYYRAYQKRNKEKIQQVHKEHYEANKEVYKKRASEWRLKNPEKTKAFQKKYSVTAHGRALRKKVNANRRIREPEKTRATWLLNRAIRDKKIFRGTVCVCCAEKKNIEGHHNDYSKPFDVVWMCRKCHLEWHKKLRAAAKAVPLKK